MERKRDVNLLRQTSLNEYKDNLNVSSEVMEQRMRAILSIQASQYRDEKTVKKK